MSRAECRKRWKARRAERDEFMLNNLRAYGAACRNCRSYVGNRAKGRCDLKSDFYGVCTVVAEDLCLSWGPRPAAPAKPGDE